MRKLVVVGCGGLGREVLWAARAENAAAASTARRELLGFVDDNPKVQGQVLCDVPVLGPLAWLESAEAKGVEVTIAVGSTNIRRRIAEQIERWGLRGGTVRFPSVTMSDYVTVGEGSMLLGYSVLTTQITIGRHVLINLNVTIGHDVQIGDFCTLNPGVQVSGGVTLGDGVNLGTGAALIQGVSVGAWSVVGAGAVVTQDMPARAVIVGVPGKVAKENIDPADY